MVKKALFKKPNASETIHTLCDISEIHEGSDIEKTSDEFSKGVKKLLVELDRKNPQLAKIQKENLKGVLDELNQ